jgi:outer membrane protein OmpA-like peptidoglycan-associated protein/polyisoprenoid-binding protein YceI
MDIATAALAKAQVRLLGLLFLAAFTVGAQQAKAEPAWILDPSASSLTYQSIKKNTIVETNSIRNITGRIEPDGSAKVEFDLDSVDTGVDLRNVRMRFLFFETFKYPTATLTAKVDLAAFADLKTKRRMTAPLTFSLDLHGVAKEMTAEVVVTMITDGMVSVASKAPIAVHVDDFGLLPAIEKLQQAANVSSIVPTASVSFDFIFNAEGSAPPAATASAEPAAPAVAEAAAPSVESAVAIVEQPEVTAAAVGPVATDASKAEFTSDECLNRFEVLSKTGSIYFREGSARLDGASKPVLDAVIEVVGKCPKLKVEVSGHTDSDGSDDANLRLSERRAHAVVDFIHSAGVPSVQLSAVGYGESKPVVDNDTDKHKALNRRIEFAGTPLAN